MKRITSLSILVILIFALPAIGNNYRSVYFPAGYYHATQGYPAGYYPAGYYPVYSGYSTVNITSYVPYPVYQPVAFATYQPVQQAPLIQPNQMTQIPRAAVIPQQQQMQQDDNCAKYAKALEARIAQLEAAMSGKQVLPQQQQQKPEQKPEQSLEQSKTDILQKGLAIVTKRCGSCHDDKTAKSKGDGFVLLKDGALVELTDKQVLTTTKKVLSGNMPKTGSFAEGEAPLFMEFLLEHSQVAKTNK
jgi:mono/diheme cytochrome c family protein